MKFNKSLLGLVAACSLTTGCLHYKHVPDSRPALSSNELLSKSCYKLDNYSIRDSSVLSSLDKGSYTFQKIEINGTNNSGLERKVVLNYYVPKNSSENKKIGAIVTLPVIGGHDYPAESFFAKKFVKRYANAIINREKFSKRALEMQDLSEINNVFKEGRIDTDLTLDWLEKQNYVDTNKFGLFGISLGSIRGLVVMPFEERIKAGVFGLTGGDIPYIIMNSDDKGITRTRESVMKKFEVTKEKAEDMLRESIYYDPNLVAPYIDSKNTLLIIGASDKTVPAKKGFELREVMNNPETYILPTGHVSSLIYAPWLRIVCTDFFDKHLK